jgi:hypothetical protein
MVLNTLSSNSLNQCPFLIARDVVSYPHKILKICTKFVFRKTKTSLYHCYLPAYHRREPAVDMPPQEPNGYSKFMEGASNSDIPPQEPSSSRKSRKGASSSD